MTEDEYTKAAENVEKKVTALIRECLQSGAPTAAVMGGVSMSLALLNIAAVRDGVHPRDVTHQLIDAAFDGQIH